MDIFMRRFVIPTINSALNRTQHALYYGLGESAPIPNYKPTNASSWMWSALRDRSRTYSRVMPKSAPNGGLPC